MAAPLFLGSQSQSRQMLLREAGIPFTVVPRLQMKVNATGACRCVTWS